MHRFVPIVALALVAAVPTVGSAQVAASAPGVIELGVDAGVSTTLGGDYHVTTVSVPTSTIRAGFYLNEKVSLEPSFGLNSISSGGEHLTSYNAELGVLLHGPGARVGSGVYLRPFGGISGASASGTSSETQSHLGVGVGVSLPFAERMATRLELAYAHGFASTYNDGVNMLGATIGLSFFNH